MVKLYTTRVESNIEIDTYNVLLEGESIYKQYSTSIFKKDDKQVDTIIDIVSKSIYDNDELFAWGWFGIRKDGNGIISEHYNPMVGIRLRKGNIQIGDGLALQKLFKEERGTRYYIGEIFVVDSNLVPNARRDYFEDSPQTTKLEKRLKQYFDEDLDRAYHIQSEVSSYLKNVAKEDHLRQEILALTNEQQTDTTKSDENKVLIDRKHHEVAQLNVNNIKKRENLLNKQFDLKEDNDKPVSQQVVKNINLSTLYTSQTNSTNRASTRQYQ